MIHSLLSSLPNLTDDEHHHLGDKPRGREANQANARIQVGDSILVEDPASNSTAAGAYSLLMSSEAPHGLLLESIAPKRQRPSLEYGFAPVKAGADEMEVQMHSERPHAKLEEVATTQVLEDISPDDSSNIHSSSHPRRYLRSISSARRSLSPVSIPLPPSASSSRVASLNRTREISPSRNRPVRSLPALLVEADRLFYLFPPTHPSFQLEEVLGPASAMRTWSEDPKVLLSDDAAEAIVVQEKDIVVPWEPVMYEHNMEQKRPLADGKREKQHGRWFNLHAWRVRREREELDESSKRRRLRKQHRHIFGVPVEQQTVLAGAVFILGVTMAVSVYGMRGGARSTGTGLSDSRFEQVMGSLKGLGGELWTLFRGSNGLGL